ncbi:hypothetical protein [Haladaptatus salinisoli]|uniref:hypothetical protein n=1 Tax=Haladaptatus salinisoli TaxID=2884876 RepID=UPI001D0A806E|nr:hypothetical protein [Haladaptatus salinisoli]
MPVKETSPPTEYREIDRWDGGVGWVAHPDESMQRASHALAVDDGVWLVDPLDAPGIDDLLAELGDVEGVVVLLDRHVRDAEAFARRYDVPLYLPTWLRRSPSEVAVRRFETSLADTGFRALRLFDNPAWQEAALYDEASGTLVVPESVGTADYYRTARERLGVHPAIRLLPPDELRGLTPRRILVSHGAGVFDDAPAALADALDGSRRRYPALLAATVRRFAPI